MQQAAQAAVDALPQGAALVAIEPGTSEVLAVASNDRLGSNPFGGQYAPGSTMKIVDDEPFNVDYLEQELEDLGYTTVSASNGQEALEKVTTEAPDLILLEPS